MKQFIAEQLKRFISENISLQKDELGYLLKLAMNSSFDNEAIAKNFITKNINKLNELPSEVTLYRVIFADSPESIDSNEIGSHYVLNRRQLEQSHHQMSHVGGGKPYMVTVKAPKTLIDAYATLTNKVQYPHEDEITLANKGAGAKIIKISEFKPSDDLDFLR